MSLTASEHEIVWTWADFDHATAAIAERVSSTTSDPSKCVILATVGADPSTVLTLAGILRTDIPIAVTSAKAGAEAQALSESLRGHGYDVISVHEKKTIIERSTSSARTPLPASSVLIATSGSSGKPKVVINSWIRTVGHRPRAVRPSSVMNWRAGQRQLTIGPLHHAAPLTFFTEGLTDGNTLLVPQRFDAAAVIAAINDWQVEWLNATPYHLRHLAAALRARHDPALPSVRGLLHLAAPCPDRLKRDWIDLLGPDRVFEMYGATEGIGLTIARGDEWLRHPGTVGLGFFTEIRVLDSDGRQLPVGETGDIYMRSGSAARRHHFQEGQGVRTADGFATVGDQGWIDGEGYLYLTARQLTRIQVGGETVDPGEIESILARHPDVVEAAVAGIPDERLGESLVAFVISTCPASTKLMKAYLRERLASHKVPRVISFVDELPHTEIGKIDRVKLKALATRSGRG